MSRAYRRRRRFGRDGRENDYDPFGSRIVDAANEISDNRYCYNGKEEQAFVGVPYIDYGARIYDSKYRIAWNGVDSLAEKYPGICPRACRRYRYRFLGVQSQ